MLLPVKPFALGKSRLGSWAGAARRDIARAIFLDTMGAILHTPEVCRLIVVTADPEAHALAAGAGAEGIHEASVGGLNAAARLGAAAAAAAAAGHGAGVRTDPVAVVAADLPALKPRELASVLAEAGPHPRAVLADHRGHGSTVLTAQDPSFLLPGFEGASRARHAANGAYEIAHSGVPGARLDVDVPGDLALAAALGLGTHTAAVQANLPQ
ncbi:2-phospho-L-lactate guanylyltransferase [Streptomyces sp. AgN23]|uniref:2-phospho-L-lactate guanylyltransferase n=1 Tax=Streptomyces sp. AgN23 TaxID=1188315 RepID=UPI001FF3630D|nr:2-phospho-L-lactate guanylyltransferase [Streptomyces sp. AgN23]WTB02832.1 2-phospho-L-lactate guanylyltransferase [Streptomyces antimycoticus]WTB09180.1 2-phospho-L-lactate guanylyltransferase [Streptomyces antimycoticus]WTB11288.1 2-phospho-L-lactate guanylyltransferase [Streptomyces antimycoticus]